MDNSGFINACNANVRTYLILPSPGRLSLARAVSSTEGSYVMKIAKVLKVSGVPPKPLHVGMDMGAGNLLHFPVGYAMSRGDTLAAEDGSVLVFSNPPSGAIKCPLTFRVVRDGKTATATAWNVDVSAGDPIKEGSVIRVLTPERTNPTSLWAVTTCMGRRKFLEKTTETMVSQPQVHYVLVDWSCPEGSGDWVRRNFPQAIVVDVPGKQDFNLSAARNAGASVVPEGEWIFFVDCDIMAPPDFSRVIIPRLKRGTFLKVKNHSTSLMGTCVVNQLDWKAVGGYDEIIRGWGMEDFDFYYALSFRGLRMSEFPGLIGHVEHGDNLRVALNGAVMPDGETVEQRIRRRASLNESYVRNKWIKAMELGRPLTLDERTALWKSYNT